MRTDPRKACANKEERLLWAIVHDGIAHPLMAATLFSRWSVAFHDWTSRRAWPRPDKKPMYVPGTLVEGWNFEAMDRVSAELRKLHVAHVKRAIPQASGEILYQVECLS